MVGVLGLQTRKLFKIIGVLHILGDLHASKLEFQFVKRSNNSKLLCILDPNPNLSKMKSF